MKPALRNSLLSAFPQLFDNNFFGTSFFQDNDIPAVNVREEADHFQLEVIAPGMKKEDFKLAMNDGTLTVSAETKSESEEKKDSYRRKEYSYKSFSRTFNLPEGLETDTAQANYADGVLKIDLKKKVAIPKPETKLIPID
ncbi:Hsp20/alpha crystallin family protein [Spirosoma aureum]|uniref:Hsp20/alpha crystallin family protein n=1 Tax=Spirosoma aureum TaxID=2692134 RepID=A0A6G9AN18_9BACT|nr:Hsp20/alpha crystallin family protein [Spirosoma aureum]QIP13739.1 Hsp20/alpha crystallin family protein [Spirosoma aureum]